MVETRTVVDEGYGDIYEILIAKKQAIEEKYRKLAEAEAEKINAMIAEISHVEEVEVPAPVEDGNVAENAEGENFNS